MDIIIDAFRAALFAGLPVGVFTLAIVWWTLNKGILLEASDPKALEQEMKALKKGKKNEANSRDFVHEKWLKFGGGFYGIVAFYTYTVVEVTEIADMVMNVGGIISFLQQLDLGVIIGIFIEALINFIKAMVWPVYWMSAIDSERIWLWLVITYLGYWQGMRVAQLLKRRGAEGKGPSSEGRE